MSDDLNIADRALASVNWFDPDDLEALAAAEHESWSGWMKYLHPKLLVELTDALGEDAVDIFQDLPAVQRYLRQMNTKYEDLSEEEKESDRIEARKKLKVYRP